MSSIEKEKDHSEEFRELLKKHNLTQLQAAELITDQTKKKVVARTVRYWLANENAKTKVRCPEWAIHSLKLSLKKTGN